VQGRRRREKIGPSKKLAAAVLAKRKVQIAENKYLDLRNATTPTKFKQFADEYKQYASANYRSVRPFLSHLKRLTAAFGHKYLDSITPQDIEKYKLERAKDRSTSTVNRDLTYLKRLFNLAIKWGKATKNPVREVKFFKEPSERLRYLSEKEYKTLLIYLDNDIKPIVQTAFYTGMRLGEILNLKWVDIDFNSNIILVKQTKTGSIRDIPINSHLKSILQSIPRHIETPYVFCKPDGTRRTSLRKAFSSALRRAGITDIRFQDLRHTFASRLVMSGADLKTVQELMGHKSIKMTLGYSHLSNTHKSKLVEQLVIPEGYQMDTNMDTMLSMQQG
jgi:integrase